MYSNIKLCRCQLKIHQNIDKKLVYQILKSPAIEMTAGLNFNIQMIYLSKKTLSRQSLLTHDRKRSLAYNEDEQYKSVVSNRAFPSLLKKLDEQES